MPDRNLDAIRATITDDAWPILKSVLDGFLNENTWPSCRMIHHKFVRSKVEQALDQCSGGIVREQARSGDRPCRYELTLLGSLVVDQSGDLLRLLVRFLDGVRREFLRDPEVKEVESESFGRDHSIGSRDLARMGRVLGLGHELSFWGGGSFGSDPWRVTLGESIDELPEVDDLRSWLESQLLEKFDADCPVWADARDAYWAQRDSMRRKRLELPLLDNKEPQTPDRIRGGLNEKVEEYAELLLAEALDQLAADERRRLALIDQDYAARGLVSSSGRINEIRLARLEFVEKRVIARIEARLRAYRKFGAQVDDEEIATLSADAAKEINGAARQIASDLIAQLRASGVSDRGMAGALHNSVTRDAEVLRARLLRRIKIMGMEEDSRNSAAGVRLEAGTSHDLFLSHAGEDKETIARPLKEALESAGYKVWFDEAELTLGDSLRGKIDEGLRTCRFGIVVLSPAFFGKPWPTAELDGLSAREAEGGKVILPIVHRLTLEQLAARSPTLAGRIFVETEKGLDVVVAAIARAIGRPLSNAAGLDGPSM